MRRTAIKDYPEWARWETQGFEVSKAGHMKRFVMCQTPEDAVTLGHIVNQAGAQIRRIDFKSKTFIDAALAHYYLPEDTALATFEIIAYFTSAHAAADHMRGRLTETGS